VVHRARYHLEKYSLIKPSQARIDPSHVSIVPCVARMSPLPALVKREAEHVSWSEEQVQEQKIEPSTNKRKEAEQGGEGPCEGEMDATLKYVIHDLAPELYIELMAGFHN
jgi:hypothetical protein